MSQYDSEIEQIEHELTVLGRQSVEKGRRLVELRRLRGEAFKQEMRILGAFKEDAGFNFAMQSIIGEEESIRCKFCNKLLRGMEFRSQTCAACKTE